MWLFKIFPSADVQEYNVEYNVNTKLQKKRTNYMYSL